MHSVLFVCTGNHFRSPIAAEVFRQQLRQEGRAAHWTVYSAGTWTLPGQPPLRLAADVARALGLDLSGHITRLVDAELLQKSDLVLVMEAGQKEAILVEFPLARGKVHLLTQVLTGLPYDIPDPASAPEDAQEILGGLVKMVRTGSGKIVQRLETAW